MPTILVKVYRKGGAGSGNFGHTGRPGLRGGSGGSGGGGNAVESSAARDERLRLRREANIAEFLATLGESDEVSSLDQPEVDSKYIEAAPTPNPPERDLDRFLSASGPVELYHMTDPDLVDSILKQGLIPAKVGPLAQDWIAPHTPYATYFFADRGVALQVVEDFAEFASSSLLKVTLPRTRATARLILPDEDVSLDPNYGLRAFNDGESIALIGGAVPETISVVS